mmetsp:Transcript_10917/g.15374  ORF Transcript_10917/g.15374 Transcript_10917/m.15374 type:complete len:120 (-) Transcript_10917:366-725(-)
MVIVRRNKFAAMIRLAFLLTNRLESLAPPHVQKIENIDIVIPDPAKKNPPFGVVRAAVPFAASKTLLANKRVTELTDVKITWAHHENQLLRRRESAEALTTASWDSNDGLLSAPDSSFL